MSVSRTRILDLMKVQCRIFSTTFNPERLRLGNKVLRQRLRGPTLASYYPPVLYKFKDLMKAFPGLETWDEQEEERLEKIIVVKARGKGPPKKKRTAEEGRKFKGKKRPVGQAPAA